MNVEKKKNASGVLVVPNFSRRIGGEFRKGQNTRLRDFKTDTSGW